MHGKSHNEESLNVTVDLLHVLKKWAAISQRQKLIIRVHRSHLSLFRLRILPICSLPSHMEYGRAGTAENSSRYRDTVACIVHRCFFVEIHEAADNAAKITNGIEKRRDHSTAPCGGSIVVTPCEDQWRGRKVTYDAKADEDVTGGESGSREVALKRCHDNPSNGHGSEATHGDCIVWGESAKIPLLLSILLARGTWT